MVQIHSPVCSTASKAGVTIACFVEGGERYRSAEACRDLRGFIEYWRVCRSSTAMSGRRTW